MIENTNTADQTNVNTQTEQVAGTDVTSTTEGQENTTTTQPFKTFATEEDFNKAIKSERSKAKHEVLKELSITSLDEAKALITKAVTLEQELTTTKQTLTSTNEQLALIEIGVKDEYKQEALTLAKTAGGDLKEALKAVVGKLPIMAGKPTTVQIGGQQQNPKDTQSNVTSSLKTKYPWMK